ncbi:MAG: SDR family NAD(P)-dependent oxidoreductase [Gemmatimonadota bacterium]
MSERGGALPSQVGGYRLPGLEGTRALVTGGSRGVGREVSLLLGRSGARVGVAYRSRQQAADEVVAELGRGGASAWAVGGDLSQPGSVAELFREVDGRWGGLDILVANHGIWPPDPVPLWEMEPEQWRRTLSENLDSIFHLLREGLPRMASGGSVVLVSSTAAQRGEAMHGDYAASKGALVSLVKGLCVELAPRGIRANVVAPGWIDTEMAAPALPTGIRERVATSIPLGRVASAADVAGPIVFLCTPLARHITGEVLNVNGGAVLVG